MVRVLFVLPILSKLTFVHFHQMIIHFVSVLENQVRLICVVLSIFGTACQTDDCNRLCADIEDRVNLCIDKWPTEWEHLDANNADEFRESCQNEWAARSELMEIRERQQAKDQCQETIRALDSEEDNCNMLRSVYFYDP